VVIWLIQRGWGRLLLLVLAGLMLLAAFTRQEPPRPDELMCVVRNQAGAWGEGRCPHAPARQPARGGDAQPSLTNEAR
jgi:hypothetical protein